MSKSLISVGVWVNGSRPKTKARLKQAIADGADVRFEPYSPFHVGPSFYTLAGLDEDLTLTVAGPDPSTRTWFAQVSVVRGKVRVT